MNTSLVSAKTTLVKESVKVSLCLSSFPVKLVSSNNEKMPLEDSIILSVLIKGALTSIF